VSGPPTPSGVLQQMYQLGLEYKSAAVMLSKLQPECQRQFSRAVRMLGHTAPKLGMFRCTHAGWSVSKVDACPIWTRRCSRWAQGKTSCPNWTRVAAAIIGTFNLGSCKRVWG